MTREASALPPAFWRFIRIGEKAGLVTSTGGLEAGESQYTIAQTQESVARILAKLHYSATEFYLLVTLLHAAPRPVSMETLARETLAESESLGVALDRLHADQAIVAECEEDLEAPVKLTPSGSRLVLLLIYWAFRAKLPERATSIVV